MHQSLHFNWEEPWSLDTLCVGYSGPLNLEPFIWNLWRFAKHSTAASSTFCWKLHLIFGCFIQSLLRTGRTGNLIDTRPFKVHLQVTLFSRLFSNPVDKHTQWATATPPQKSPTSHQKSVSLLAATQESAKKPFASSRKKDVTSSCSTEVSRSLSR